MNGYMLDRVIKDILTAVEPLQDDWAARFQIINELRDVVQSIEILRGATIDPFGSFVSNLFSRWGDLDISVQLHNGSYVSTAGKKLKQSLLKDVQKALRKKGGWYKLQLIAHARVPILKIENIQHNISCDISIDNLVGQIKSKILLWLNDIDGRFHDMVMLVKEWAKAHDINNPKQGTFNSYSLSLLVIFHLQTCSPAIFPPLKDIYPGNVADNLKGVRAEVEQEIAQTCAANIARFKSRTVNKSSLSDLFISFLAKFSDLSSKASELGICPYTGQWLEIESNMRWLPKTYTIFIEDPFEQPENTARGINARQLMKISEAFQSTHFRLTSAHLHPNYILNDLARPHVSQLIIKSSGSASVPAFNIGNYYPPIRPQFHQARVTHSRPYIQHQFQNNAPRFTMGNSPPINAQVPHTGTTQSRPPVQHKPPNGVRVSSPNSSKVGEPSKPPRTSNGQGQQKWRPRFQRQVL
ncbi:Protein HESO1, partial [Cucurbita argyrosperma subsp. sororia]